MWVCEEGGGEGRGGEGRGGEGRGGEGRGGEGRGGEGREGGEGRGGEGRGGEIRQGSSVDLMGSWLTGMAMSMSVTLATTEYRSSNNCSYYISYLLFTLNVIHCVI